MTWTDKIRAAFLEKGPMNTFQLSDVTGIPQALLRTKLSDLRKVGQPVYIHSWGRETEGRKNYLRAVYHWGRLRDADAPKPEPIPRTKPPKPPKPPRERMPYVRPSRAKPPVLKLGKAFTEPEREPAVPLGPSSVFDLGRFA